MSADHPDRPAWMGKVDFSGMKLKLIASIVAISAIHLLKAFMEVASFDKTDLMWLVIIHLTFVVSGVLMALMDWITGRIGGALNPAHNRNGPEDRSSGPFHS